MRVAIVGCGFIGNLHAQAVKELGHTLALVVDSSEQKAQAFANSWKVDHFGVGFQMALEDDIQCIHICTPPALHYSMAKEALLAGKHVICEKPLCLDPGEGQDLLKITRQSRLVNAVNFNVRFYDACRLARDFIAAPDFGNICLVHGSYLQEFHALPAEYSWRYQPELAGRMRATTEIGSHWIDLIRYWTGLEIAAVSANFGKFSPHRFIEKRIMYAEPQERSAELRLETEDAAVISLRFSNDAIGSLLLSEVSHGRSNLLSVEVTGDRQSIWWNSEDPYRLSTAQKLSGVRVQTNPFSGGFPDTFKAFFSQVYQDIASGRPSQNPPYPTFYDGYINALVCAAIYDSAQNNSAWVNVIYDL